MSALRPFPGDFLWGAATAAYQIEGSPLADGAGPCIWHQFAHTPGHVRGGDTGDVACDHYRRMAEDVALMARLGLRAYRFSVSWSRILPQGRGHVHPAGLGFYERLVDALLERDIVPLLTLYHWDLPAALDMYGGWLNPDSPHWFADYAEVLFRALGDRVRLWITINEPWVVAHCGYLQGVHAPGHRNLYQAPMVSIHLLQSHALAVAAFRACCDGRIGIALNLEPQYPATQHPADVAAAQRREAYVNRQYLDPLLLGRYPPELARLFGEAWPRDADARIATARGSLDFLGINYYTRAVVRAEPRSVPERAAPVPPASAPRTAMGWEIHPQGLADVFAELRHRAPTLPLYITENGAAFDDPPAAHGLVDDGARVRYLGDHLRVARAALAAGSDLRGYFVWSLLDNFEWQHGYSRRFGIVHVDFASQRRTPKHSAWFYRDVIHSHGRALDEAGTRGL